MSSPCKMAHGHSHQHGCHHHAGQAGAEQSADAQQDPPDYRSWDIVKATQHGLLDRCRELVEAGYDVRQPDGENVTLLHWAAINNRLELVRYLISKGAVVDQLGGTLNSTPLHWAVRQGHLQMVILLMKCGGDPSLIDGEGYGCIHLAVLFQHLPIIAYLVAKGQSIDTPDVNGMTPLMLSAQRIIGVEPTSFLLKFNPSLGAVDKAERNTALHWAALSGNVNAMDLLLEAGAGLDTENAKGQTPLDIACQSRNRLVIHILTNETRAKSTRSFGMLKLFQKYEMALIVLLTVSVIGALGYILDLNTDSWLMKGVLVAPVVAVSQLLSRRMMNHRSQRYLPAIFFSGCIFWAFITWFVSFLPDLALTARQVPFILSATSLLYFYYKTWRSDPGFVKSSEEETKQTIISLAEAGRLDPRMFCVSCLVRKPVRSMHCPVCGSCVARFDQHCLWTGRCVGAGNQRYYVLFLGSLVLVGHGLIFYTSVYWAQHCTATILRDGFWAFLGAVVDCSPWVLYIFLIVCCFTIWATLTLLVQIYQIVFLGLTTQERLNLQIQNRHSQHWVSLRKTPFNRGCVQNVADFFHCRCFGLIRVDSVDWTKQYHAAQTRSAQSV
ncbi:palmitoyltransferase ZDHHC13 [Spea bombifrons]|uniref:palmitoyltransferase ZDHHC13 n=1 Tax=Spea bombifrons TaxID=233779 RepID=UPI00234BBD4F|nr:palmitoyltransferase ZDHHC13 [Spea bombifrons]